MARQPRILLIDHDPLSRQTLGEVLEAAGFVVVAGTDPADLVIAGADADVPPGVPWLRLVKPVRVGALLAAIRDALARRGAVDGPLRVGPWRFDPGGRLLEGDDGRRVRLTDKETAILDHLLRAGGTVARETLLAEVWGYSAAVTTHTLETHVYRLRRKIEADPARAEVLVTEVGGYRLVP